jgi:hypothetical protein
VVIVSYKSFETRSKTLKIQTQNRTVGGDHMTETVVEYVTRLDFIPKLKRAIEVAGLEAYAAFDGIETAGECYVKINFNEETVTLTKSSAP